MVVMRTLARRPRDVFFRLRRRSSAYSVLNSEGGSPRKEAGKVKTPIVALLAAVLITAAPAVDARNVSTKSLEQQHKVFKKRPQVVSGYAPWPLMQQANGAKTGYPGAFGYAPGAPKDYTYDNSRNAGGGGGGGGGGGM
jgi:hypothetical protein